MKQLYHYLYLVFGISLFLQIIPNSYLFGVSASFLSSNVLSLFFVTIVGVVLLFQNKTKLQHLLDLETKAILLFFITQILSGLNAVDFSGYLSQLFKIAAGIEFYFVTRLLMRSISHEKYHKFIRSLAYFFLAGSVINILIQLFFLIFPQNSTSMLQFFSANLKDVTSMHLQNKKIYSNFPIESLIPLLVVPFLGGKNNRISQFTSAFLYFVIIYLAVVSNFRYRLLTTVFVSCMTLIAFKSVLKHQFMKFFTLSILGIIVLGSIVFQLSSSNTLNRIVDPAEYSRFGTVAFRLRMQDAALELGMHHLIGVGLGNFPLYMYQTNPTLSVRSKEEVKFATAGGPHNLFYQVFAESGFLGAGVLVFLTLLWLHSDLKNGNATKERTILTIILWTLFLTAQFNPVYAITFFTLCFTLRGLITES